MTERLYVFSYDISSNRSRRRVSKRLEEVGVRVQGSVFEARLTQSRAERLAESLEPELGPGDSLKLYAIGPAGLERSRSYGAALPALSGDFVFA